MRIKQNSNKRRQLKTFWKLEKSNEVVNYYPTTSAQETKQTYLIMLTWANSLMVKGIERNKHI